ncbi:hypothetical protein [Nibricoccus sp. IMCC34717]|uniref:hypothetical protein n=1 Tax=Nibricoccus sp. IMCC34717 TaxID=3034021 RepID=UPI00384B9E83
MDPICCRTCAHFRPAKPNTSGRLGGEAVGECRSVQPIASFTWPRVRETDECGKYLPARPVVDPLPNNLPPARASRGAAASAAVVGSPGAAVPAIRKTGSA